MADEQKVDSINVGENKYFGAQSNEEIVAEITENIEEVCINRESSETNSINFDHGAAVIGSEHDDIPVDFDDDTSSVIGSTQKPNDFIDEDGMKIDEVNYTEEEREIKCKEADTYKSRGNDLFKSGEYRESADCYTLALRTCPLVYQKQRSVMYCNRAAAKMKLSLTATAIEDCSKAIELDPTYLKAYFRRAQLYEIESDKLDEALADYKKILELDPTHREANAACQKLPKEIEIRNEKMKTEMLGKLKDLGNMILRPFGLSTNNFQLNPDPSGSGGYSINFTQNAG